MAKMEKKNVEELINQINNLYPELGAEFKYYLCARAADHYQKLKNQNQTTVQQ